MYRHPADQEDAAAEANNPVARHAAEAVNGTLATTEHRLDLLRYGLVWLFLVGLPLTAISGVRPPSWGSDDSDPLKFPVPALSGDVQDRPRRLPSPPLVDEAWFQAAQDRLRRQGAVYVRLEKWHSDPAVYCFSCRRGMPGEQAVSDGTDELSALSTSPQVAVGEVIRRLEMPALSRDPLSVPSSAAEVPTVSRGVDGEPPVRLEERQADRYGPP